MIINTLLISFIFILEIAAEGQSVQPAAATLRHRHWLSLAQNLEITHGLSTCNQPLHPPHPKYLPILPLKRSFFTQLSESITCPDETK